MELQPETEPGFPPMFASSGHRNLNEISIAELVSVLRADLDRVEGVLVARDSKHKAEIGPLQEKIEVERLMRLLAEGKLKKREEQYQKLKMAQESYERLLKEAKESRLRDENTIEKLRNKNYELERENRKLMELKRKGVDELKNRVAELENESVYASAMSEQNLLEERLSFVESELQAIVTKFAPTPCVPRTSSRELDRGSGTLWDATERDGQQPWKVELNAMSE